MRIIVTRPAAQAAEWVEALRGHGIDATALPLIGIAPAHDRAVVIEAWSALGSRRLVVFVSPNAAEQFFACRPEHSASPASMAWPAGVLAGSPGPGTTQVLRRFGVADADIVEPAADSLQFDSEALWTSLGGLDWRGASVLIVRGDGGREWLADTLKDHGATVDHVAAYRRTRPAWGDDDRALLAAATARPGEHLWFFSSSEAIDNLADLASLPTSDWQAARALATHPRIAERARRLGFATVALARPALPAVVACLQSMQP